VAPVVAISKIKNDVQWPSWILSESNLAIVVPLHAPAKYGFDELSQ
jgi:hypothetical protein